jgi:hypothetical protein
MFPLIIIYATSVLALPTLDAHRLVRILAIYNLRHKTFHMSPVKAGILFGFSAFFQCSNDSYYPHRKLLYCNATCWHGRLNHISSVYI